MLGENLTYFPYYRLPSDKYWNGLENI